MVGRILIYLLFTSCAYAQGDGSRVVNLAQGPVRGYHGDDGDYFAFYGIPYATAPTGRDKYKAPLPAPIWSETFEAIDKKIICQQKGGFGGAFPQEDQCLIANVYVPETEETNLPVVVYIHGGAFEAGYGNMLTPKEISVKGEFIAVNFNYRLGVHGFLCLGTEQAPGNAGMKDMVALLRWVKENIQSFGGNPNDITISGYSAGSAAADLLTLSKATEGLFHKVILESGSAISAWGVDVHPFESAKAYAALLNLTTDNVYELEEFYITTPLDDLFQAQPAIIANTVTPFVPCIERETGVEMFLDDAPFNILKKEYVKFPSLVGFTEMEGRMRLGEFTDWSKEMNNNFADFLPIDLQFASREEKDEVAKIVKEFYFGANNVSEETVQAYVDFQTDTLMGYPALRSLSLQVDAGNNEVFLYKYSFFDESDGGDSQPATIDVNGAGHSAQTEALLDRGILSGSSEVSNEYIEMQTTIRMLWINFIKTGRPVPEGSTLVAEGWPSANAQRTPYMILDNPTRLDQGSPWPARAKLWDDIYEKHYRMPEPPPPPPASWNGSSRNLEIKNVFYLSLVFYLIFGF